MTGAGAPPAPGPATRPEPVGHLAGRPVVMTQTWSSIVWCHWPVPADLVARRLPPGLRPDLHGGTAWVGFVPFEMRDLRLAPAGRRLPAVPTTARFHEVNVRTYVDGPLGPGVWFDSLDASSRLGTLVARVAWSLPYVPSRITAPPVPPGRRAWSVQRADGRTGHVEATVAADGVPGTSLDRFLTERYALYARAWWTSRRVLWAPVAHPRWELHPCTDVDVDAGLVRAAGYPVGDTPPHVLAGDAVAVRVGLPRAVRTGG